MTGMTESTPARAAVIRAVLDVLLADHPSTGGGWDFVAAESAEGRLDRAVIEYAAELTAAARARPVISCRWCGFPDGPPYHGTPNERHPFTPPGTGP